MEKNKIHYLILEIVLFIKENIQVLNKLKIKKI